MGIAGYTPPEIDPEKPDVARIYDHVLGGVANVAVDRAAAKRLLAMTPEMSDIMRANRAFLRGGGRVRGRSRHRPAPRFRRTRSG